MPPLHNHAERPIEDDESGSTDMAFVSDSNNPSPLRNGNQTPSLIQETIDLRNNQYNSGGNNPHVSPRLEAFPVVDTHIGKDNIMSPPEINIDFAPPSPNFESPPTPSSLTQHKLLRIPPRRDKIESSPFIPASFESSLSPSTLPDYVHDVAIPSVNKSERPQKYPASFQCSLCLKRFTRVYNLRSHLRTHTDEKPFVCRFCGKAFARQHDRKRHEGLHSVQEIFACGGDLKSGGHWGCGRRFARADALGRHLRSEAGRICMSPLLDEEPHLGVGFPSVLLKQYPDLKNFSWSTSFDASLVDGSDDEWLTDEEIRGEAAYMESVHKPREEDIRFPNYRVFTPEGSNAILSAHDMPSEREIQGERGSEILQTALNNHDLCHDVLGPQKFAEDKKRSILPVFHDDTKKMDLPPPVKSDSGYHSGLGTDTESVCSMDSDGNSLGLPRNFLQEFIAFFGDTLIEQAGARQWAGYALAHHSPEDIENRLSTCLKEYTVELASKLPSFSENSHSAVALQSQNFEQSCKILTGATNLIRRYRPKIARYFRSNAEFAPVNAISFSARLQELGQQLSLTERFRLLEISEMNGMDPSETEPDIGMDEELEIDAEEGELYPDLESVRELLISGEAFQRLVLNLRQKLYHDDKIEMEKIRTIVLEDIEKALGDDIKTTSLLSDSRRPSMHEMQLHTGRTIVDFMHSQFKDNFPQVGSVLVLTGTALYAQATTCAEYIMNTWPKTGRFFLQLLDAGLAAIGSSPAKTSKACSYLPLSATIEVTPHNSFDFIIQATDKLLFVEMMQQVAWISSVLSISPYGDKVAYAKPLIRRTSSILQFTIDIEHQPLHDTEAACWLPLFYGASIASGFPIPERADEMGLEIPLELLAGIAGVRHVVEYEGGVVMKGFSHMLVPVRKKDDCVQWHAISSQEPETRLTYQDGISRCHTRASLQEVSFDDLQKCRTIIGWCSVAASRLGSTLANYENIDYSKARETDSGIRCTGGHIGVQQFVTGAFDVRFGAKDGKCHFQRNGPFQRIVSVAERTPVVLYDTRELRAWLVPASNVMLHIVQHRHRLNPFKVDGKQIRLDTTISATSSASDVLLKRKSLRLYDDEEYTFKDDVLNIWSILEFLLDQNVSRYRNAEGASIKGTLREFLHGFEYNDVVRECSPYNLKETQLKKNNGGWPLLVRDIDALVLLADGFEDIIVPAEEGNTGLCRMWQRVPKGEDYLATSTKLLQHLYDKAGCRLDRECLTSKHRLQWHQGASILFDVCKNPSRCECDRLQEIVPKSAVGTVVSPKLIVDDGAVIFGRSKLDLTLKRRTEGPKISGIYSQANAPLPPIVIRDGSEDSSGFSSTLSGGSGSDMTERSMTSSISSWTTLATEDVPSQIYELDTSNEVTQCAREPLTLPKRDGKNSSEDESDCDTSFLSVHKRARPLHCYQRNLGSVCGQRHTRPDSILQESDTETNITEMFHYPTPTANDVISGNKACVGVGERRGSTSLAVKHADDRSLRSLRPPERYNWKQKHDARYEGLS